MTTPPLRTLLEVLQELFPDSSNTTLRKILQSDRVLVNGVAERNARRTIGPADDVDAGTKRRNDDPRVRVLFEDADLVVIDKAAGLLTVPGERRSGEESAESILNTRAGAATGEQRIHHVHRLDFDTSGVLVFAKNTFMRDRLRELFAVHDVERVYVAIVHGALEPREGTIRSFLAEDRELRVRSVASGEGKEAITHYRTLSAGERYSHIELTLETGRRNQIRVHMAEAGHPVVGDAMYGSGRSDGLGRLALHARLLAFVHPGTGRKATFTSGPPREIADARL